eukprot:scaffold1757_cov67-Cylindrotheca_fusiformis.AAC.1
MQHEAEDVWVNTGQQGEVPATVSRVVIAENTTRNPDEAPFEQHQELEEEVTLIVPSSVREIGKSAFYGCKTLNLESLCLKEGLERIGKGAFGRCEGLTKVDIPSTVKVIEDGAFQSCTRTTLSFSVREIGNNAFLGCKSLERLSLHEGLERIGSAAFKGCTRLGGADIPPTVQVIHNGAFQLCTSLERLGLEEGVRFIGEAAFKGYANA